MKAGKIKTGDRISSQVDTIAERIDRVNRFLIFKFVKPYTKQSSNPCERAR